MPQGLDVTTRLYDRLLGLSRLEHKIFGLIDHLTPTCGWITCGYPWARVGHRVGIAWGKAGKTRPTGPSRSGPGGGCRWKARRTDPGRLWTGFPQRLR